MSKTKRCEDCIHSTIKMRHWIAWGMQEDELFCNKNKSFDISPCGKYIRKWWKFWRPS